MAADALHPTDLPRRGFVWRRLVAEGARFRELNGMALATGFGDDPAAEEARARRLGLADLSPLPRTGFKGRDSLAWLKGQGLAGLEQDNVADLQPDGALAARLAPGEAVVLSDLAGGATICDRLDRTWPDGATGLCFPVGRQDANFWFMIGGEQAPAMFTRICGVDLRPGRFAEGAIAQTSVARLNAIVIRAHGGQVPGFHILGDSASADWFRFCLLDAMAEFDGGPVGHDAILAVHGG